MNEYEISAVTFKDKTYSLDNFGFLSPPDQWDENFAEGMAEQLEIYGGLTGKHWSFINYIRKKFLEEKTVPVVVIACADNNLRLKEYRRLFPTGYHRGACKIAGINYEFMLTLNHWLTYETSPMIAAEYKLTPTGFLVNFGDWKEEFARKVIREWKLSTGFTEKHRQVVEYLRNYYSEKKNIPTIFETCDGNELSLDTLKDLFPEGYRRGACRIAGLPFLA